MISRPDNSTRPSNRQGNVELLRIVLMFMIVMHHVIVHGLQLKNIGANGTILTGTTLLAFMDSFLVISVNCFVLISGYFGIQFKSLNVIGIVLQATIVSVLIYGVVRFFMMDNTVHLNVWNYWFLVAYFSLTLVAQYVNRLCEGLKTKEFIAFMAIVLFLLCIYGFYYKFNWLGISGGASFIQVLALYCLGRFLYRIKDRLMVIPFPLLFIGIALPCILNFALVAYLIANQKGQAAWNLFAYNNPLVLLSAVAFFVLFLKLNVSFSLRIISSSMFGVYLIHDNAILRDLIIEKIVGPQIVAHNALVPNILIFSGVVFLASTLLSIPIVMLVFGLFRLPLVLKLCNKIDSQLRLS